MQRRRAILQEEATMVTGTWAAEPATYQPRRRAPSEVAAKRPIHVARSECTFSVACRRAVLASKYVVEEGGS